MRELYNSDIKSQFIESLPAYKNERIKKNYENLFYSISKYERQLDKDFCEMNVPEVKMTMVSLEMLSVATVLTMITLLRDYNNWCIANGKTNFENSLLKIQASDIDLSFSIQNKLLKSPEHLNRILQTAFGEDDTAYQKQSRLIAWLLYYGLKTEEIKLLKKKDIDIFKKNILKDSKDDPYLKITLDLMNQCSELSKIKVFSARHNTEKIDTLFDSEYILRGKKNSRSEQNGILAYSVILTRIRDINVQYANVAGILTELTVDRIYKSGVFYKLYQYEQQGKDIKAELICKLFEISYKSKLTISNEVSKKLKDYRNWKKAFDL